MIRQGDVLLIPTKLPQKAKLKSVRTSHGLEETRGVQGDGAYKLLNEIQETAPAEDASAHSPSSSPVSSEGLRIAGERTGHAHELACDVYVQGEKEYAVLSTEATMTHQEHQHLKIPAGVYEVKIQREYVPVQRTVTGRWD